MKYLQRPCSIVDIFLLKDLCIIKIFHEYCGRHKTVTLSVYDGLGQTVLTRQ